MSFTNIYSAIQAKSENFDPTTIFKQSVLDFISKNEDVILAQVRDANPLTGVVIATSIEPSLYMRVLQDGTFINTMLDIRTVTNLPTIFVDLVNGSVVLKIEFNSSNVVMPS